MEIRCLSEIRCRKSRVGSSFLPEKMRKDEQTPDYASKSLDSKGKAPAAHSARVFLMRLVPSSLTRVSGSWRTRSAGVSPFLTTAAWVLRAALASRASLAAAWCAAAEAAGAGVPLEPPPWSSALPSGLAGAPRRVRR